MKKSLLLLLLISACSGAVKKAEQKEPIVDSLKMATDVDKEIDEALAVYSGQFEWQPEGGAEGGGSLSLRYDGNREFTFSLSTSLNECGANLEGKLFADRSQHAAYQSEGCLIHFNFLAGDTIEIIEERCDKHAKECGFAGDYVRSKQ
jgi:hypothetical protein